MHIRFGCRLNEERFSRSIVGILAKRAGNICSNPECSALTVGPAEQPAQTIIVGEAAHIFGAKPGSARFMASMIDADRSDVTNGIWLCRNCHKIIDSDPTRFPAELLFEWRRDHERSVMEKLGKGGILRQKVMDRRLEGFEKCSYLAQQMIIDKPDFWEYKLTAELLRSSLQPIKDRWNDLQHGLYAKSLTVITSSDCASWLQARIDEILHQSDALEKLTNFGFQASWGAPGEAGSEREIQRVCGLVVEACRNLLDWEERIRFVSTSDCFKEVHLLLEGIGGRCIDRVFEFPVWLANVLSSDNPTREYHFTLVFDLPEGWSENFRATVRRATETMDRSTR